MAMCTKKRSPAILMVLLVGAGLAAGCGTPIHLPAAQTPVLESILAVGSWANAAYHHSGVYEMPPGAAVELRLRAPWPTTVSIRINDNSIPMVSDTAAHPEHAVTGFYRKPLVDPVSADDPLFFWRIFVSLPDGLHGSVNYNLEVDDTSADASSTGGAKNAAPLSIDVVRSPPISPRPSSLFFSGPDAKHQNVGGDSAFIRGNVTVAGWLVAAPGRGLTDPATEDWHYDILLDNDFIQRNYASVNKDLAGAVLPGRWYSQLDAIFHPNLKIPLATGQPDAGTFLMPGTDLFTVELNAWHPSRHGGMTPPGWVGDIDPATWPDIAWPFPVLRPLGIDPGQPDLREGDYVIITGALVEDSAHLHFDPQMATSEDLRHLCWFHNYQGHGGWLEIHPVDAIRRVPASQAPLRRKHAQVVQVCREDPAGNTPLLTDRHLTPVPATPPTNDSVLRYTELIDPRFTDMDSVLAHTVKVNPATQTDLEVYVLLKANQRAAFKATYLLWWEEASEPRPGPDSSSSATPSPPNDDGLPPICQKKPYLPQCGLKLDDDQNQPTH